MNFLTNWLKQFEKSNKVDDDEGNGINVFFLLSHCLPKPNRNLKKYLIQKKENLSIR